MFRKTSLFLLFSLLIIPINGKAKWNFNGELGCPKDNFLYHLEVYEEDLMTHSDDLLIKQADIDSIRPHKYEIEAEDTDDGIDFGRKFEIYMLIIHNCTTKGNMKKVRHDWGTYDIDISNVTKTENIEIFDKGEDI